MLADDKGRVCEWDGVSGDGCCAQALPDSCKGCDMARGISHPARIHTSMRVRDSPAHSPSTFADRSLDVWRQASSCCFEFEFCVACCQQSNFTTSGLWKKEFRTPGKARAPCPLRLPPPAVLLTPRATPCPAGVDGPLGGRFRVLQGKVQNEREEHGASACLCVPASASNLTAAVASLPCPLRTPFRHSRRRAR